MEIAISIFASFNKPIDCVFKTDDHVAVQYTNGVQITLDFDDQWCRIHRSWTLQKAFDLSEHWHDPVRCSELIMSEIQNLF